MMNDFDLELISLMELREINREKRFRETSPDAYAGSKVTGNQDLNCPTDHFNLLILDNE